MLLSCKRLHRCGKTFEKPKENDLIEMMEFHGVSTSFQCLQSLQEGTKNVHKRDTFRGPTSTLCLPTGDTFFGA